MTNKIEAIIDAVGKLNGMHNPESAAYALRNPMLLRSFARPGQHEIDAEGRRAFKTFLNGYRAAYFDVGLKISGNSIAKLSADSTLSQLLTAYRITEPLAVDNVVSFLRRALQDQTISRTTPLEFFRTEESAA